MKKNFNEFWAGNRRLLGKIRHEEDYQELLRFFFENQEDEEGFSYGGLPDLGYSKLSKLESSGLLEVVSQGSDRKMLVDLDVPNQKPCFDATKIDQKVSAYGDNLLEHALVELVVMETIISILGKSDIGFIKEFLGNILENLKNYNQIIEAIQIRGISTVSKGYGRLSWRPVKAKKFRLAKQYRQ